MHHRDYSGSKDKNGNYQNMEVLILGKAQWTEFKNFIRKITTFWHSTWKNIFDFRSINEFWLFFWRFLAFSWVETKMAILKNLLTYLKYLETYFFSGLFPNEWISLEAVRFFFVQNSEYIAEL